MYLATIGEQSRIFFYSVGMGFLLGIFYSVLEFFGFFLPEKRRYIIPRDIFFMVSSAFLLFIFTLSVNKGKTEFHIYSGAVAGFFICFFSLGKIFRKTGRIVAVRIKDVFIKFKSRILKIKEKISKKDKEKMKKSEISSNLLLQDDERLLYNSEDNEKEGKRNEIFIR